MLNQCHAWIQDSVFQGQHRDFENGLEMSWDQDSSVDNFKLDVFFTFS